MQVCFSIYFLLFLFCIGYLVIIFYVFTTTTTIKRIEEKEEKKLIEKELNPPNKYNTFSNIIHSLVGI